MLLLLAAGCWLTPQPPLTPTPAAREGLSPRAVALLEAAAAADQAGQPAISQRIQAFLPRRNTAATAGGQLSTWAQPLLEDPQLIPFSAEHLAVMAKLWDATNRELQASEQDLRAIETLHPGNNDRRRLTERLAKLHAGQETIMAVRSFRQRFPTAWTQSHPLRAAAVAASHPIQTPTLPAQETQAPASPAGSTPAERQFTPEETAVLNHLVQAPPPGVGERPAVPHSPAPSLTGPATATDSPRSPTPPPVVLQEPVDITQLGAAGGPLSPSSPLGVSRQPGWGSFDLNRPQDPQMWPDPTAPQAATSPAQQGPPLGPLATLPRPTRN